MSRTKLETPTGKIHRNFKLARTVDNKLRRISKLTSRNQTTILEDFVLRGAAATGEIINLSDRAKRVLFREAILRKTPPMALLEACVLKALAA